jgi:hypothetical protein
MMTHHQLEGITSIVVLLECIRGKAKGRNNSGRRNGWLAGVPLRTAEYR